MTVHRWNGSAAEFHARSIPPSLDSAEIWVFTLERPALVLGSSQRGRVADDALAQEQGVEVVRRNSGGGAVLLVPGRCLWIDVLLPRDDPRWNDDVGRSAYWLGEAWATALREAGQGSAIGTGVEPSVHRNRLEKTPWGRLVCFGAVGPGEVTVGGRKVVGISQRRTRDGARFQCLVLESWDPLPLLDLLVLSAADRARARDDLRDLAAGPGVPLGTLEAAVVDQLDPQGRTSPVS
jgi:lipoate-protein ligase A